MYSYFCEKYGRWANVTKATMRIQHKPGNTMEVDWAGATLDIHDPVTGEVSKAYLFVAVLPCSCFTYAEACDDMKLENWISCHIHAYNYFGGVTRLLVPDNLKTGITKNTRYETVLNRTYQEMAEYYGTAIVPARVRHPKDKSHAEGGVNFASTWILAALRSRKFFSVEEAKTAVAEKQEELNARNFKKRPGSRREAYLEEEKEFMGPLPSEPYEPAIWSPDLKVGNDYLVSDGKEPEQGYKYCASLTKLSDRYGPVHLENARKRLLSFSGAPSIRTLSTILKNGQDRAQQEPSIQKEPIQHGITRGADYFRK